GVRLGQVEGEGGAVVNGDRAPQWNAEQVEKVAAGAIGIEVRGVVARARKAGRDQRRAVAELLGEARAALLAGASLQIGPVGIARLHRPSICPDGAAVSISRPPL